MPYVAARETLLGRPVKSRDQRIAEAEATTVEGVRQAAFAMWILHLTASAVIRL
jgi:hypothetical protein